MPTCAFDQVVVGTLVIKGGFEFKPAMPCHARDTVMTVHANGVSNKFLSILFLKKNWATKVCV
jgi:hypothetical protein